MTPFCVIIKGPPAVGKSTIARRLANAIPNTVHVDVDAFKHMISTQSSKERTEIAHEVSRRFVESLAKHKYNIVVEEMFRDEQLTPMLAILRRKRYRTVHVFLTAPANVALRRNSLRGKKKEAHVIKKYNHELRAKKDDIVIDTSTTTIMGTIGRIREIL